MGSAGSGSGEVLNEPRVANSAAPAAEGRDLDHPLDRPDVLRIGGVGSFRGIDPHHPVLIPGREMPRSKQAGGWFGDWRMLRSGVSTSGCSFWRWDFLPVVPGHLPVRRFCILPS